MTVLNEVISSRANPSVKLIASLKEKKHREREGLFLAEGEKLTLEAINSAHSVSYIVIREDKALEFLRRIREYESFPSLDECRVLRVSESVFEKISSENSPQGVISVIKHLDIFSKKDIIYKEDFLNSQHRRALILCSVRDPGNLGAVIRSAVAFGVEEIILSSDCADLYNPKTVRGAMGSLFRIRATVVCSLSETIENLKLAGRRVFAAELREGAIPLGSFSLLPSDVFIIGNEGHGIDQSVSLAATKSVYIPISAKTESLNAAVASAIVMWEQSKN